MLNDNFIGENCEHQSQEAHETESCAPSDNGADPLLS